MVAISKLFGICYESVRDWAKRYKEEGDYSSKRGVGCGGAIRFTDKDKILEYHKSYNLENKTKIKIYRENNKENIKKTAKKYKENNKEKILKRRREYESMKKQKNPIYKFTHNVKSLIGISFKRGQNKFIKNTRTEIILGCTIEEFRIYIENKFTEGMSFDNHGEWHLDHIVPISSAQTQEEVIKLNHYTNFQPLWAEDNLKKSNKIINQLY